MRELYRMGEIGDSTLVWKDGEPKWSSIKNVPRLRYNLLTLPEIPSKKEFQIDSSNPIAPAVNETVALACEPLNDINKFNVSLFCSRCGAPAYGHAPGHAEQQLDMAQHSAEIGFTIKHVSEIIPGFLWVGNQASSRPR